MRESVSTNSGTSPPTSAVSNSVLEPFNSDVSRKENVTLLLMPREKKPLPSLAKTFLSIFDISDSNSS
jgi:hypothetical protein